MKRSYLVSAFTLGAIAVAGNASATLINFDSGQANGTAIGAFYSGLGVTFSNARWTDNFGYLGSSGSQGVYSISGAGGGYQPQPSDPITASFGSTISTATLRGCDVGNHGFLLRAYDSSNNLVDSQQVFGSDVGDDQFFDLTVTGPIAKISFSQATTTAIGDGILFDDLSFTSAPVPEPATMATLGLGALAVIRRRRAKK